MLRYSDEGSPEQLAVLFLHAFPYHRGQWEGQRAALRGKARFLSMDMRGMGPGAPAVSAFLLEQLVDDVLALLDTLAIERAVLCGCSMGGYVALRAVEREPARVRGLILVDTQAAADSDAAKLARAAGLRTLASEGKAAFASAQLKRQLSAHTHTSQPALVARLLELIEASSSESIAANMVALATRTDVRSALPNIHVPTRIIVGADDVITTPEIMRSVADAIPRADFHVLPRAGHVPNLEAEGAFNALLLSFLAELT